MMRSGHSGRRESGFGLIEVLVSVVVIAIGLLGIAKMHALAIGNTRISGSRAVAAIYAGSMSSAMQANPAFWQTGTLSSGTVNVVNSAIGATPTLSGTMANLAGQNANCTYSAANPTPPTCTPTAMAAHDLRTWGTSLQQLPAGNGTVVCTATTPQTLPVTCTITTTWEEKSFAGNNATASAGAVTAQQNLVVLVQP